MGVRGGGARGVYPRARGLHTALATALALHLGACASTPPAGAPSAEPLIAPWALPPSEHGQQSLFRLQFGGERGEGTLRAALRLETPSRFELAATDALGRQVWTLSVAPDTAIWLDHRGRRACPLGAEIQIADLGLPPLPLAAVPALLLGRLPLVPSATTAVAAGAETAASGELRDGDRRWSWRRSGEQLAAWTLYQNGSPALWWRRDGDGGVLSARRQRAQLRWQRVLAEPAELPVIAPATPAEYRTDDCHGISLP
jgi:hypothetical protein